MIVVFMCHDLYLSPSFTVYFYNGLAIIRTRALSRETRMAAVISAFHCVRCWTSLSLKCLLLINLFFLFQTLPEVCSEQDELDFLMEALIIRCV